MHFAGSFALWLLMMREASRGTGAPPTAWAPEDLDVFVQTEQARAAVEAVVAAQLQRDLGGCVSLPQPKGSERPAQRRRDARNVDATKHNVMRESVHQIWAAGMYGWIDAATFSAVGDATRFQRGVGLASRQIQRELQAHFPEQCQEPKAYCVVHSETIAVCKFGHGDRTELPRRLASVNVVQIAQRADAPPRPHDAPPFLTAGELIDSFDMRQCAVAVEVDARLRKAFTYSHETLECARRARIVFSQHAGFECSVHTVFARMGRYLERGFTIGDPPEPPAAQDLPANLGYEIPGNIAADGTRRVPVEALPLQHRLPGNAPSSEFRASASWRFSRQSR